MRTIFKYPVHLTERFELNMPMGAEILSLQMQRGEPQLWAVVDSGAPFIHRWFQIVGTGQPFHRITVEISTTFLEGNDNQFDVAHVSITPLRVIMSDC